MRAVELCLSDAVKLMLERGKKAQKESGTGADYERGVAFGIYEAVSLLHQQVQAFGLEPQMYGFPADFVAEKELL